jgi:hypothetical protein
MPFMTGIAVASLALSAAGTATTLYGEKKAGDAAKAAGTKQREASESQAQLQDFNAKIADLQAQDAIERGADTESRYRTQVRGAIGTQRAGIAGNNIRVGFGSAVDVQGDAAYLGELDALQIRTNSQREAWGFRMQATDLRKRAEITRKEGVYLEAAGGQAKSAANLAMAGTLIGGASSLLGMKYGFDRAAR